MKLTEHTLAVLKNFASINPNLVFDGTSRVRTIAENKSIIGIATLESTPDKEIGIYDLNEFLGALSLVDNPLLEFDKNFVVIGDSSGRSRTKFYFADPFMLTFPTKEIVLPSSEVSFTLTADTFNKIKKAASTLSCEKMFITHKNGVLEISVSDPKNKTANKYSIDVAGKFNSTVNFKLIFEIGNIKILSGDYDIEITKKLFASFKNKGSGVDYFITLDSESSYVD